MMYVLGSSQIDSDPRAGTLSDPHRSLIEAMGSLEKKYTIIKLLGSFHDLSIFYENVFPEGYDPSNPFEDHSDGKILKVIFEPEFCSNYPSAVECIADDAYVTIGLPSTQFTFDFGFAVEFHWVIFDG